MPATTLPPKKSEIQSAVWQSSNKAGRTIQLNAVHTFLRRELDHWKADLEQRKCEGEYLLEWFSWNKPIASESDIAWKFQQLVGPETASLIGLIESFSKRKEITDLDRLAVAQKAYISFCNRFDRMKLLVLKTIDFKGSLRIY